MKNAIDIQNIRQLLDRYYSGDASGDDISRLKHFFASATMVPPDLEADRAIFAMMADSDLTDEETAPPEGLQQTLLGIAIAPKRRKHPLRPVAAAAAVIVVLAICAIYILKPSSPEPEPLIAKVTVEPTPGIVTLEDADSAAPLEYVPPVTQTPPHAEVLAEAADPYIEVTDSAEAARITVDVLRKMRRTMNMAMNTTEEITGKNIENLSKVKQILDKIQ